MSQKRRRTVLVVAVALCVALGNWTAYLVAVTNTRRCHSGSGLSSNCNPELQPLRTQAKSGTPDHSLVTGDVPSSALKTISSTVGRPLPNSTAAAIIPIATSPSINREPTSAVLPQESDPGDVQLTSKTGPLPWFAIGIPSVPRPGVDYLTGTIRSIVDQVVAHEYQEKVVAFVINNAQGKDHPAFRNAQAAFHAHAFVRFLHNPGEYQDNRTDFDRSLNRPNAQIPNAQVRRQTLDVVYMLDLLTGSAEYALLYEDDFELCSRPNSGLLALKYIVDRANTLRPDWISIRCAFGMSGIIFQQRDVPVFRNYLYQHYNRRPPDHLVVEWYAGETAPAKQYVGDRRPVAFRWNLLPHQGTTSSLRSAKSGHFPGCFQELVFPTVFEVEAFNPRTCPTDDVCVVECCPAICRCAATAPRRIDWTQPQPRGVLA